MSLRPYLLGFLPVHQRDYNINEHYKTLMFQKMIKDLSIKYDYQEFVDNFDKPEYYNKDIFEL